MLTMAVVLTLLTSVLPALPPNNQAVFTDQNAKLRSDLLSAANYDYLVPPKSSRQDPSESMAGTDVELEVRFFKVETVDMARGSMRLKVWYRMTWQDTRLSWDPSNYGGITYTNFMAQTAPGVPFFEAEIWTPDFQPYNAMESITNTLDASMARVLHDGTVFFSRPGALDVICRFSGLVAFPFDNLKCAVEIGGWVHSSAQQGLTLSRGGKGYHMAKEVTTAAAYQEYEIYGVTSTQYNYTYRVPDSPLAPTELYPVVLYEVTLRRTTNFYILAILFPGACVCVGGGERVVPVESADSRVFHVRVWRDEFSLPHAFDLYRTVMAGFLVTMLSFAVFFTDTASADPLGYGIGTIVVVLLNNLVLIGMLPVCGELLWIDLYMLLNTSFCFISLAQSSISVMIENFQDEHLLPLWLVMFGRAVGREVHRLGGIWTKNEPASVVPTATNESSADGDPTRMKLLAEGDTFDESYAAVLCRQMGGSSLQGSGAKRNMDAKFVRHAREQHKALSDEEVLRLMLFERARRDCGRSVCLAACACAPFACTPCVRQCECVSHDP